MNGRTSSRKRTEESEHHLVISMSEDSQPGMTGRWNDYQPSLEDGTFPKVEVEMEMEKALSRLISSVALSGQTLYHSQLT